MKKLLILFLALILMIGVTGYTTKIDAPSALFETQTSTSVNVSGMVNASLFPARTEEVNPSVANGSYVNVSIMNKSCQSCSYGMHSSYSVNISNINGSLDVFWNQTITLGSGYNWILINFTNVSIRTLPAHRVTTARIINIDPDMYKINLGGLSKINLSLDTGIIQTAGNLTMYSHPSGNAMCCGVMDDKTFGCATGACS